MDTLEQAAVQVATGDSAAFQIIVSGTSDRLVRLAARLLGNVSDAEDVVQEAYVKAYRALLAGQFDGRSSVATWLYRIVTRSAIDELRSNKRRAAPTETLPEQSFDGLGQAEARLAVAELKSLLEALPGDQRVAIVLKSVEGLSTPEIARILDCSEGAVEQRLVRARATLRGKEQLVSDFDVEQRLAGLARASEGIRARPGFSEQVMLAALSSGPASLAADLSRSLRRMLPLAVLAAALSVFWALISEQGTDDAFAAADETVELEW